MLGTPIIDEINKSSESKKTSEIKKSDITKLIKRHGLGDNAKKVIKKENLLPKPLLNRLHQNYTKYSCFKPTSEILFTGSKKRYSGLKGFREILRILKKNSIMLGDIKERELFIEVYRFLATKHVLNTIDWFDFKNDAVFQLVFPQPGMINSNTVKAYSEATDDTARRTIVKDYMEQTNPHDGKQKLNRPSFYNFEGDLEVLEGSQHKYPQCFLLFDKTTQSCFAFCTYCFRHAQVRGDEDMFIQDDVDQVHDYLRQHKEITDILVTGGDGGFMPYNRLKEYLIPIIEDKELLHIRSIRIASRALTFHPEIILDSKFDKTLGLFQKMIDSGIQVLWIGHFSAPKELLNIVSVAAVRRLRNYGLTIRSQSPMMKHISLFTHEDGSIDINRSAKHWIDLANILMMLSIGFHSLYCARPTGEHKYFTAPLSDINKIFSEIYRSLPSIGRPSRYITMTSSAGKTSLLGTVEVQGKKAFVLKFNEARNMKWLDKVFLAEYDDHENTIEKLKPFDSDQHFYENELEEIEQGLKSN